MNEGEMFEVHVGDGVVRGRLDLPSSANGEANWPAVLVCRGISVPGESGHDLVDELVAALNRAGLACARFEHRCADLILEDFHAHGVNEEIDDAAAVMNWLQQNAVIDPERLGVLGHSLGGIAACGLARRSDRIARLALLAAPTADYVAESMTRGNGSPALVNPEHLPRSYIPSLTVVDSIADAAVHDRPTLVLHGAADRFVPPTLAYEFDSGLRAAARNVQTMLVARADHTFQSPASRQACFAWLAAFFQAMAGRPAAATNAAGNGA